MVIKVLGSGCSNCTKVMENVKVAVKETGVEAEILKVEDFKAIMGYGVMKTPAVVIDEKVKAHGRIPTKDEIVQFIKDGQ